MISSVSCALAGTVTTKKTRNSRPTRSNHPFRMPVLLQIVYLGTKTAWCLIGGACIRSSDGISFRKVSKTKSAVK